MKFEDIPKEIRDQYWSLFDSNNKAFEKWQTSYNIFQEKLKSGNVENFKEEAEAVNEYFDLLYSAQKELREFTLELFNQYGE